MLAVDCEIEQKHGGRYRKPGGQGSDVEKTPSLALGQKGHADAGEREEKAHNERIEHDQAEIIRPAPEPADLLRPPWRQRFPQRHDEQDAEKETETEDGFGRNRSGGQGRLPSGA